MARNGSGSYSLPSPPSPLTDGTTASAADVMTILNDIGSALTQSVSKDGQTAMTGALAMGSNKITGLGNGTASGDAVHYGQFTNSLSLGASYQKLPGGLIVQFGFAATSAGSVTVTWPIAFPTKLLAVVSSIDDATSPYIVTSNWTTLSLTSAPFYATNLAGTAATIGFSYIAIGY